MARIFCLPRFLGLILCCCCGSQAEKIEISIMGNPPQTPESKVEFKCETDHVDAGVFWVLQKPNGQVFFISYVTSRSKEITGSLEGYQSSKVSNHYQLTIESFQKKHEGTYFCVRHRNQKLLFSLGIEVRLPVKTPTVLPTTPQKTSATTKRLIKEEPLRCPNSTGIVTTNAKSTVFPCELYIWVPLAGVSLLLLITVISLCCGLRRRRRRCKCIRPTNGTNGTHMKTIPGK